jgi:membrane-associated phospholipid phosphatase
VRPKSSTEGQMETCAAVSRSRLLSIAGVLVCLAALSILTIDIPVAIALSGVPEAVQLSTSRFTGVIEVAFGFPLSIYASGLTMLAVGGALAMHRRFRSTARVIVWIAIIQLTTRFAVDVLKPMFDRLRPHQAISNGLLHDRFFAGVGNSFPSGHAAHFWGFFFALALLFPKWWLPLIVVPVLVSVARVIANDHYVSDVLASAAVAALVTLAYCGHLTAGRVDRSD